MGLFKFIAKRFSMGPAVKVWVDAYNNFYNRSDKGLVNHNRAEEFFNYIIHCNVLASRQGDNTMALNYHQVMLALSNTHGYKYEPSLDLPSFLAIMMYFEIELIREAFAFHPDKTNSLLEIIYEVCQKNAPNSVLSKRHEYLKFSKYLLVHIAHRQI